MVEINFEITTLAPHVNFKALEMILDKILREHGFVDGFLNVVIIDDSLMRTLHGRYLGDSETTDVMSFEFDIDKNQRVFEGEVYANADQVSRQAKEYKTTEETELVRIILHGTLHLVGFDDKTAQQRKIMREKEDLYLREY